MEHQECGIEDGVGKGTLMDIRLERHLRLQWYISESLKYIGQKPSTQALIQCYPSSTAFNTTQVKDVCSKFRTSEYM